MTSRSAWVVALPTRSPAPPLCCSTCTRARPEVAVRDDFDLPTPGHDWIFARNPNPAAWSLADHPGALALRCTAPSPDDLASFSGLLRRQRHFVFTDSTRIDFSRASENEEVGLIVMMDYQHHYEIAVTRRAVLRTGIARRRIGPLPLVIGGDRKDYHRALSAPKRDLSGEPQPTPWSPTLRQAMIDHAHAYDDHHRDRKSEWSRPVTEATTDSTSPSTSP